MCSDFPNCTHEQWSVLLMAEESHALYSFSSGAWDLWEVGQSDPPGVTCGLQWTSYRTKWNLRLSAHSMISKPSKPQLRIGQWVGKIWGSPYNGSLQSGLYMHNSNSQQLTGCCPYSQKSCIQGEGKWMAFAEKKSRVYMEEEGTDASNTSTHPSIYSSKNPSLHPSCTWF